MKSILLLAVAALLAGCASTRPAPDATADTPPDAPPPKAVQEMGQALTTPLSDLNLMKVKIPPLLAEARKAPYRLPDSPVCAEVTAEVEQLDAVLEPDFDATPEQRKSSALERGAGMAGKAAVGAVRSAAADVIPFRGWVRKLTGAERHAREVDAAIAAGNARRAYLKGYTRGGRCDTALVTTARP
ncbi:hypothetical protein [Azohydromonas aeria]|uniref:hypothetical protein n=1 Tax=Azohydromonas aeria TaxID=2590212 RepID=UPI001E41C3AA|nr:hypothetical protein [Azohydromonas aeria]